MATAAGQIDSVIDIATPENIAFQYQVAGPLRRVPAFLIDLMIRAAVFLAATVAIVFFTAATAQIGFLGGILLLWFVLEWFYGGLFETYWNGQTPGKWLTGIRVLTVSGQPINGMQAVMRNILRFADMMPLIPAAALAALFDVDLTEPGPAMAVIQMISPLPTYVIGLAAMSISGRYQRLGDLVCGTMVIVEERSWLRGLARVEDPRTAMLAAELPVGFRVSRSLAQALVTYVDRRRHFPPARRAEIARHLGEPLVAHFNLPADTSHDLLLCALYYRTFITDQVDEETPAEWRRPPVFYPRPRAAVRGR